MRKNFIDTINEYRTRSLIKGGLNATSIFESFREGIEDYYTNYSIESIKKVEYSEAFIFYLANSLIDVNDIQSVNYANSLIKYKEYISQTYDIKSPRDILFEYDSKSDLVLVYRKN